MAAATTATQQQQRQRIRAQWATRREAQEQQQQQRRRRHRSDPAGKPAKVVVLSTTEAPYILSAGRAQRPHQALGGGVVTGASGLLVA